MVESVSFELSEGAFHSLSAPLRWESIPPFAVITGPNGSGKTQFLQLLNRALRPPDPRHRDGVKVTVNGLKCQESEIAMFGASWALPQMQPSTLQHLEQQTQRLAEALLQKANVGDHLEALRAEFRELLDSTGDPKALASMLPPKALFGKETLPHALLQHIGHVFRNRHLDACDLRLKGRSESEIRQELGPAPWEVANEILGDSSIPYRLTTPEALGVREPYLLQVVADDTGAIIGPHLLSDGEKVLFNLIVSLFTFREYGLLPKVLLLDEPDAHLHTEQIGPFLGILRDTLVRKHGCRVLMTTHRPDTLVQLGPDELFEMRRTGSPRLVPCESPSNIVGRMAAQTVDVLLGVRCVLVEDEADISFYEVVRDALRALGRLKHVPTLAFRTPSVGAGKNKTGAGCTVVEASVTHLRSAGLTMVRGLVDGDGHATSPPEGVHRLPRHSIENYLFDPLNIYARLVEKREAPHIADVPSLLPGDEHRLHQLPDTTLQSIVDHVAAMFEPDLIVGAKRPAVLATGQTVSLPAWAFERRGHDLQRLAFKLRPVLSTAGMRVYRPGVPA
ncbi:MAG: AAA family ATPase [Myxococcales bacterium]|nr:AAA family ATPase [Myxococcales bacterium]